MAIMRSQQNNDIEIFSLPPGFEPWTPETISQRATMTPI